MDSILQDVRFALRLLRRNPLFTLTAALSLAVGIGANTTIFSVANTLLFRPPAGVVDADRLVDIGRSQDGEGFDNNSYIVSGRTMTRSARRSCRTPARTTSGP